MGASAQNSLQQEQIAADLTNKGQQLQLQGKFDEAIEHFNRALHHSPNYPFAYYCRGITYHEIERPAESEADLGMACRLAPDNPDILFRTGKLFVFIEKHFQALPLLQRVVELTPSDPKAWTLLAECYYRIGKVDSSKKMFAHLVERFPDDPVIKLLHETFMPQIPQSNEEIDQARADFSAGLKRLKEDKDFMLSNPETQMRIFPFYNAYHGRNHKEHAIQLAELVLKTTPSLSYVAPHCKGTPKKREKIRIGFLSEFMHKITVNQFFKDIVEGLAQDKDLEIYVFSNSPIVNPTVQEVAGKVHKYVRISGELQDLRAPIAREEIDILIFLEIGIAQMFYFLAFSRLAPIQIVCGGHPITTGIPTMDYFLSTKGCHGDNPQAEYTEKPLLLERIIAVFHRPPAIEKIRSRKELGLPEEGNLYSCPVTLFKLHPDMDKIFSRILERDPKARIILFDPILPLWRSQLEARFIRTIPPAFHNRIHFIPFAKKEVFLEMMHCMDAVLDPLHFSFGTTAYLMLGINLPFATWPGEFMRGRTADYMFKQMGIPELIGSTHEEYADIAIRLATDKQFRADMIEKIRAKSDILFNDRTAIDEFAVCLKQLYAKQ